MRMMHNNTPRLGCLTPIGMVAAVITVLALIGAGFVQGGQLFSPGGLSDFQGPALGNVQSHSQIGAKCETCHTAPWDPTPMSERCAVCHEQVKAEIANPKTLHGGLIHNVQEANCLNCHTEHHGPKAILTRIDFSSFPHEVTGFSLKAHQTLSNGRAFECTSCHGNDYQRLDSRVCQTCHTRMDKAYMAEHNLTFGPTCANCHDGLETYGSAFDHNQTGFALTGKHASGSTGQPDCKGCHLNQTTLGELQNTASTCFACHQTDDAHQGVMGTDCAGCHTPDGWKPSSFDHAARTAFALLGKHSTGKCQDCHTTPDLKNTPSDCAACHLKDDAHQAMLGSDCAACHTPLGWAPSTFDHNTKTAFVLLGKHLDAKCQDCHTTPDLKSTPVNCAACHAADDAHQGKLPDCQKCHNPSAWKPSSFDHNSSAFKLTGKHIDAACTKCHSDSVFAGAPSACAGCHGKDDPHQGALGVQCEQCHTTAGWQPSSFDHNSSAFKLTGQHQSAACATCHADKRYKGTPSTCAACHQTDDVHKGSLGTDCARCHSPAAWKPSTFNHNQTAFQLAGAHVNAACTACHVNFVFKGTATQCAACHQSDDAHQGKLGADCQRCHNSSAWKPSSFNHASSAFQLTGSHLNVQCSACHADKRYKGTPTNCYNCHQKNDPHNGSLGTACNICHSTSAWKPSTFNHANSAFPLNGAHNNVACASCHVNQVFKGTPANCYACHQGDDPHGGSLGSDCKVCHGTSAWKPSTFNHANSAFPLTGSHVGVACQRCHTNGYAGTPTACSACHQDPSYHAGLFGADCAVCHNPSVWVPAQYNRAHTFPKNHEGANTCRDCHPSTLSTYTCYNCHNQNEITKKHTEEGIADFSDCMKCHPDGRH